MIGTACMCGPKAMRIGGDDNHDDDDMFMLTETCAMLHTRDTHKRLD